MLRQINLKLSMDSRDSNKGCFRFLQTPCLTCAMFILFFSLVVFLSSCDKNANDKQLDKSKGFSLSDISKLFQKDTLIVVGKGVSETETDIAKNVQSTLEKLTKNKPTIKASEALSEDDKAKSNIIIIITPNIEGIPSDFYTLINKPKITVDYPGKNKGVLEIVRNPWNEERALLIVGGSDGWGLKASELVLRQQKLENKTKMVIDWEEYTGVKFPIDSEEEAIQYAKTDPDVSDFIKKWSLRDFKENISATGSSVDNFWEVVISLISSQPKLTIENCFWIQFRRDGILIKKGIGQGS